MLLYTNKNSDTPLYVQVVNQLKDMIVKGELSDGTKLPSERLMANLLGVHRNTIKRAYHELRADGYLASVERLGFVVSYGRDANAATGKNYTLRWSDIIRDEYVNHRIEEHFSNRLKQNCKYSFSGDMENLEETGREDISSLLREIALSDEKKLYSISHRQGILELRKNISAFLKSKGIHAKASEIQILSESFQALDYITNMLITEGDSVVLGETACPDTIRVFLSRGAKIVGVDMDENGILCDHLESLIQKYAPKLIFVDPDFQNPTGCVMSLERRKQLLDLSYRYNIPIIEEDSASELRYEGSHIPSLKALDQHESVIYIHSFYYTIPAGLRLATVVANKRIINDLSTVIQSRIVCADMISQRVLSKYLERGLFKKNLEIINKRNSSNLDAICNALEESKALGLEIKKPGGGPYLWCKLPPDINMQILTSNSTACGVSFMPGRMFFVNDSKGDSFIRFNFMCISENDILKGISLFNAAFKESFPAPLSL